MNSDKMSKRIAVTVPDIIGEQLELWAGMEGRAVANLCNYLLEKAVRDAEEKGTLPAKLPTTPRPPSSQAS